MEKLTLDHTVQRAHIHTPMLAVLTCECGERAVATNEGIVESADFYWDALDRFYAKVHAQSHQAPPQPLSCHTL